MIKNIKKGEPIVNQQSIFLIGYLLIGYVGGFIWVSLLPYWDDNGVKEYIELSVRFYWAIKVAGMIQLLIFPIIFVYYRRMGK